MKTRIYLFSALAVLLMNWPCLSHANRYFINVHGTGARSGESWENAYSNDEMLLLFPDYLEDGDSLFIAEGVYTTKGSAANGNPGSLLYCKVGASIFGGYPSNMTGTNIELKYPSSHETVFSGDLTSGGVPNTTCSSNFMYYFTENKNVDIKGITFCYCYHAGVNNLTTYNFDNAADGKNAFGALVVQQTKANIQWCKFARNATPVPTSSSDGALYYGGALNIQGCELVRVEDCIFKENFAARCGAAIGIKSPATGEITSTVLIQRCLFDQNNLATAFSGKYGGSISINSVGNCYVVNSTFARAKYYANGGVLSSGNPLGIFYLISNTFAENDDYYYTGGSYGKNIRGSNGVFRMANNINVCNKTDKNFAFSTDNYNKISVLYNEAFTTGDQIQFSGYNLLSVTGTIKADTSAMYTATDKKLVYYDDIFGKVYDISNISSTSLANNGGFSQTMKPVTNYIGMPQSEFSTLKTLWSIPDDIWKLMDFSVDQRGYIRSTTISSIGACDVNGTLLSTSVKNIKTGSEISVTYQGNGQFQLNNVKNSMILVYNINGTVLKTIENAHNNYSVDLSSYAKGVYFIKINGSAVKVVR